MATTNTKIFNEGGANLDYSELALNIGAKFLHVIEGAAVIFVGFFVIRYVRRYIQKIQTEHENQRMALNLLEKIVSGFLVIVTLTLALKIIGLDLTWIISALTLGLSFGLKDIIGNYVSGLLILFKSPFAIGDIVKIRSFLGRVEKIDFQSTTLKTFDKKEITIYNQDILTQSIVNYTKENVRRVEISVTLGHGSDISKALAIFDTILGSSPSVLKKPRYSVVFNRFKSEGMTVVLRFWIQRPSNILKVRSEVALQIQEAFDEQNIFSPYAREIQFTEDFGMTSARKQRLQAFYSQPALAAIAAATNGQLAQTLQPVPAEDFMDIEEPEIE